MRLDVFFAAVYGGLLLWGIVSMLLSFVFGIDIFVIFPPYLED